MRERSAPFGADTMLRSRCILCERLMERDAAEPDVICPKCEALGQDDRRVLRNQAMVRLMRRDLTD